MILLDKFQTCIRVESCSPGNTAISVPWMEEYRSSCHIRIHSLRLPKIKSIRLKHSIILFRSVTMLSTFSNKVLNRNVMNLSTVAEIEILSYNI